MNDEIYNAALRNALSGIKDAMIDLNWSFILTNDGTVITSDENAVDPAITKAASSFQTLAQKAASIGGLDNMLIAGDKCNIYVSSVNDMYLVAGLTKNADLVYFRTVTGAVLPTVLKVLDSVTSSLSQTSTPTPFKPTTNIPFSQSKITESSLFKPTVPETTPDEEDTLEEEEETSPNEEANEEVEEAQELQVPTSSSTQRTETTKLPEELPSQQLIVDRFSGLMVKADTIQLDVEILKRWSEELDVESIGEVDIETFSGKTVRCKTKTINDPKLEGRGLIRIPEKTCQSLDVRRGELVRVRPVLPEGD